MKITKIIKETDDIMTHDFGNKGIPKKLYEYLKNNGFVEIGYGQFGVVFSAPDKNYVIKVNNGLYDGAYLDFATWCSKQNNIHLPKIGKIRNFDEKSYFVFIEKLEEVSINIKDNNFSKFNIILVNILKEICKGRLSRSFFIFDYIEPLVNDVNLAEEIYDCLSILSKFVKEYNVNIDDEMDLHVNNFMKRRDGTIVITDPVC